MLLCLSPLPKTELRPSALVSHGTDARAAPGLLSRELPSQTLRRLGILHARSGPVPAAAQSREVGLPVEAKCQTFSVISEQVHAMCP